MADQSTHINYSLTDIERYLQGSMSAKEMHDMERAALQDPFLADAIEGYSEAPFEQSHKHLNEITALLHAEKNDAKVVIMPTKSFQWWRVAASIIFTAGAGAVSWYLFSLNGNTVNEKNIAQLTVVQKLNTDTVLQPVLYDTTAAIAQNYTLQKNSSKNYKAKDNTVVAPSLKSEGLASKPVLDDADKNTAGVVIKEDEVKTQAATTPAPVEAKVQKTVLSRSFTYINQDTVFFGKRKVTLNEFKGRVTDNNNQPVANAIINAGDLHTTYTDARGYFALNAPDSLLNVTVSSLGFAQAQTELRSNYANNISVVPDNQSLSEIVVTGYSTEKKAMSKKAEADSLFPAGGWQSFQDYVYKKLHKKLDSTNNGGTVTGNVEIEFLVREDGTPYNFNIVRSLNQANDAQAIDIIKNGPRWIGGRKNKKAKVTIPF